MTTTEKFQIIPDYFDNEEDCKRSFRNRPQTNPRYRVYNQTHFTAGDSSQFERYRDATNGQVCIPAIDLQSNLFRDVPMKIGWEGYSNLPATSVQNTFNYIFHKFKKGIFIKIQNNQLKVFLPFSKHNYTNEWGDRIQTDPKYGSMENFLRSVSDQTKFQLGNVNKFTHGWGGNNCLLRYEYPLKEGDSGTMNMRDMFKELCDNRQVPDMEFFVNRRDFPILKKDGTEPYNHIFDSENFPLLSHKYDKYSPILGGATTDKFSDIPIPTWDDWQRVNPHKFFPKTCRSSTVTSISWGDKKPTAVFRGGSTGCGNTKENNPRLKAAYMSTITPPEDDIPLLDAGITNWNPRARKLQGMRYLQAIDVKKQPPLVSKLSPQEQSNYKYIINIDGHVTAFRLSLELSFGSVILLVKSNYHIWYMNMLKPYVHYVPVESDLSDLIEKIRWCRSNDAKCQEIASNALQFYNKYLRKNGVLDYLQKLLFDLKKETGVYLYNYKTPLSFQIEEEVEYNDRISYPSTDKSLKHISIIPPQRRSYSLLKGLEWIFNMIKDRESSNVTSYLNIGNKLFDSPNSEVFTGHLAKYSIIVKQGKKLDDENIVYNNRENIHECFVGINCINSILQHIPNFVYMIGSYKTDNNTNIVVEEIKGNTLLDYLKGKDFNMNEFLFIFLQICLALQVAQNMCGFVHWDSMPWNIIIQRLPEPVTFDYLISYDNVMRVTTKVIPVFIDYGKSHVIYKNRHYGMINMYKTSTVQDALTVLLSSVYEIIDRKDRLAQQDMKNMFKLMNFISGTGFRSDTFNTVRDIRGFLYNAKKFSVITTSDKHELDDLTPIDFANHILTLGQFSVHQTNEVKHTMNIGNARQVFEFILSKTDKERLETYTNVFIRMKQCTIPQPDNLFFVYYAAQLFDEQLTSLYYIMEYFLTYIGTDKRYYKQLYDNCVRYLSRVYVPKIQNNKEEDIIFDIETDRYDDLVSAKYTEETFLLPWDILDRVRQINTVQEDLSEYKNIIESVMTSSGRYKMSDNAKKYYIQIFKDLLNTETITMKTNIANEKTLLHTAERIYSNDLGILIQNTNLSSVETYHQLYTQILSDIKSK